MNKSIKIDLPYRIEQRYILPSPEKFLDKISCYLERKLFSNNEYVHTIYFNNDEHTVPFEFSIKARKYLSHPSNPVLNNDLYFLDLKRGKGEDKEKIRLQMPLKEIINFINKTYHFSKIPLRPYIAVEYLRWHYVPKKTTNIRLTLDTNLKYFFFPQNQKEAVEIGKENYARVEIKEAALNLSLSEKIKEVLKEAGAFPTISKKFTAYNLLGLYRAKTFGKPFYKELRGYEIESKLETGGEKIFQKAKCLFDNKNLDFRLPSHFPYTLESASLNKYYQDDQGLFKAIFRGSEVEIVRKGDAEIIKDPFGLNCLLKRKEIKGHIVSVDSKIITSAKLRGELYRMRKAFWVENPKTRRFYHISLDCSLGSPGILYEMEVEYTGRYTNTESTPETTKEEEIIKDITRITKTLLEKFPELKPSQLTKQDWLGI
jgi:hypothetical protein